MIEELIYTSAPHGLKSGSKGFCTVASTAGMAANLVSLLESLSGYRHLADPGSIDSERNPIVYNHLKIRLGGRSLQILSRVADAGLDYSGRSNKLAHHVVLSSVKLPISGPAAVQGHSGFHEFSWNDEPHLIDHPRALPSSDLNPTACSYWQEVTGDAGWGGALGERLLRSKDNEQWLIYPLGVEPLRLLEESLALLPPGIRWQTTYTTFYTKLPPGIDCRVRCVVDGTPEAVQLRKRYELQVLDLCQKLEAPPEGALTTAARTGTMSKVSQPVSRTESLPDEDDVGFVSDDSYEVNLSEIVTPAPPPLPGRYEIAIQAKTELRGDSVERKSAWVLAGALAAMLFFVAGSFALYFGFNHEWFTTMVADSHENRSEVPQQDSQEQETKDIPDVPKTDPKETPIKKMPPDEIVQGDPSLDAAVKQKPSAPPSAGQQDDNPSERKGNSASSNDSPGTIPPKEKNAPQTVLDKDAEHIDPFPQELVFLDEVIKGIKSSIPLRSKDNQVLTVEFYYPQSVEKNVLPYHLTGKHPNWTLYPSDPGKPNKPKEFKGQALMTVALKNDELVFKATPRTMKSNKYKLLVRHSVVNLSMTLGEASKEYPCDVRFFSPQKKAALRIADSPEDSTKFIRKLHCWEEEWTLRDVSLSWKYFLKQDDDEKKEIVFSKQPDGSQESEDEFHVLHTDFFDVSLLVKISLRKLESGPLINAKITWVPNPSSKLPTDAQEPQEIREKVENLFETTRKWKAFKGKYATKAFSDLTWKEWKEELETKDPPFNIEKDKIMEVKNSFDRIGDMTGIPDAFDPDTELSLLKNINTDLELGIELVSYPHRTEKQLILVTTKEIDSSSDSQK